MSHCHASRPRAFTLVELLVVIGIIATLVAILMPSLSAARQAAVRVKCLSNMRNLATAQVMFAAAQENRLVYAGNGTEQGSWIGQLQPYSAVPLVRRCTADQSIYFDQIFTPAAPGVAGFRLTSYGINNYVSPTHASVSKRKLKITQIKRSSEIVQFVEVGEDGKSDHVHVNRWNAVAPELAYAEMAKEMPIGRHGGMRAAKSGVLNYSFIDGHCESLAAGDVYIDQQVSRFDPDPQIVP
ncbi:MAG TPA: type II secretion system protein [Tepidisphaeraceae bacterium]|jgi:prepilin-type N-terminal cleavage/methylation domain-containing protein/prepilin-type processing-associated H-X9-DG protein